MTDISTSLDGFVTGPDPGEEQAHSADPDLVDHPAHATHLTDAVG